MDPAFRTLAHQLFNPYSLRSGTEHVAVLLHSLVRMTRPRTVVEYGSGYTTLFLLAALAENVRDIAEERAGLRGKTAALGEAPLTRLSEDSAIWRWLEAGEKACAVDPCYYLKPYQPHLYSFEEHDADHEYAQRLIDAARRLDVTHLLTYVTGSAGTLDTLPSEAMPIDLAWNDQDDYREFFSVVWPLLNPNGGLLVFHNTVSVAQSWMAIQWMKERQSADGDLEILTLDEPHKLHQNSCTVLRRTSTFRPRIHRQERVAAVAADLLRFMHTSE